VRGVTAPGADVFLVRGDEIVTTPIAQDAVGVVWESAAGETRSMPAVASLVSCGPEGGPLRAGSYEVYARVTVTADDGTSRRGFGGPWPLRLE